MTSTFEVFTSNFGTEEIDVNFLPDVCPWCKRMGDMRFVAGCIHEESADEFAQLVFRCYNNHCRKLLTADYRKMSSRSYNETPHTLCNIWPVVERPQLTYKKDLRELSPRFCEIMIQATSAEDYGLDEVAGPAYRKALEILIKDFLIKHQNEDKNTILNKFLGKCISEHIKDEDIKECSKRAVWIGNDETHYDREWIDVDIEVMKELIELTVSSIEKELSKKRIFAQMPEKPKRK